MLVVLNVVSDVRVGDHRTLLDLKLDQMSFIFLSQHHADSCTNPCACSIAKYTDPLPVNLERFVVGDNTFESRVRVTTASRCLILRSQSVVHVDYSTVAFDCISIAVCFVGFG